jgi:hypothetical protein
MKKRIAWFLPNGKDVALAAEVYSQRILPKLEQYFDVDLFCEREDNFLRQTVHHPLTYYRRMLEFNYYQSVFLIENTKSTSFTLRSLKTVGGLGLFFDGHLTSLHFSKLLESSVGKVFDSFAKERLNIKTHIAEFRNLNWDIEIFESFLQDTVGDINAAQFAATLVRNPNSDTRFTFPFQTSNINSSARLDRTMLSIGISPSNMFCDRTFALMDIFSQLRTEIPGIKVKCLCPSAESFAKLSPLITQNPHLQDVLELVEYTGLEKLAMDVSSLDLFLALRADEQLCWPVAGIFALESGVTVLAHEGGFTDLVAGDGVIPIRPGLGEYPFIIKFIKLFDRDRDSFVFEPRAALCDSQQSAETLCQIIEKSREETSTERKNLEERHRLARESLLKVEDSRLQSNLLQKAAKDFGWIVET